MRYRLMSIVAVVVALVAGAGAQGQQRSASPDGMAATQVDGRWIEVSYGRPILRGRTSIFGSGDDYGAKVKDGAPVWRAGANRTTLLRTEAPLEIGGTRVGPGEYALLIDLRSDSDWTLIVSSQPYQRQFDPSNTRDLFGGFNYRAEHDVARAPMRVERLPYSVDQLTWTFTDVTSAGGTLRIAWERTLAAVDFRIVAPGQP